MLRSADAALAERPGTAWPPRRSLHPTTSTTHSCAEKAAPLNARSDCCSDGISDIGDRVHAVVQEVAGDVSDRSTDCTERVPDHFECVPDAVEKPTFLRRCGLSPHDDLRALLPGRIELFPRPPQRFLRSCP
ncbi:hypothetical protein OOZ19_02605 [Saccharopolyspora sp. NFXS83]|uniref:hypothetical protein n=1 Tax=Saccharopolyspora sp. NFXS83 TaxID=2993560 RepID=UPI00224B2BDB|nr:hypothetical protein [Saccharopolyspora sp. NFXS83]MCX2729118.1 hypothetical protein [Saccharopolyspora sp. NFXS83]